MNEPYIKTDTDSLKASISDKQGLRPVVLRMRTGARIAAVQLAYSVGITQAGLPDAVPEFLDHYGSVIAGQLKVKKIDEEHFQSLTLGVSHEAEQLDKEISESLSDGWTMQRLALHELSVLRAGIYELKAMPHIPAKAVLSEYSGLADVFQCDVGFVNAVLDKLARNYRKQELSGS
jgi:N utilization substance protein B